MKKVLIFLLFVLGSIGCQEEETIENIIEKQKLVDILVDLHVSEAAITQYLDKDNDSIKSIYLSQILRVHDIEKSKLDTILSMLYKKSDYNKDIMKEVLNKIDSLDNKLKEK